MPASVQQGSYAGNVHKQHSVSNSCGRGMGGGGCVCGVGACRGLRKVPPVWRFTRWCKVLLSSSSQKHTHTHKPHLVLIREGHDLHTVYLDPLHQNNPRLTFSLPLDVLSFVKIPRNMKSVNKVVVMADGMHMFLR